MMGWQIQVSENQRLVFSGEAELPMELGRQADRSESPYALKQVEDRCRVIIARLEEHTVSRRHALVENAPEQGVRVTNLSTQQPVRLADGTELPPHESRIMAPPLTLTVGNKTIRILEGEAEDVPLRSLDEATSPPGRSSSAYATAAPSAGAQVA
ncbi:MAG TPA: hypothetical protein VKU02_02035, partial [Gemmataceae bacterium]|nr:hypothetical protein [Gemmataceae bacterium]